jgi:hypothetical protein
VADLERAAELIEGDTDGWEADGEPNSYNLPLSTKHFNVQYHRGLAHFLLGEYGAALTAYAAMPSEMNDESVAATAYWRYMALRRVGEAAAANESLRPIHPGMRALDGGAYVNLTLMFKGERAPESILPPDASPLDVATLGYGVGAHHWLNGRRADGVALWRRVVNTSYWAAFGFIAAEAELHRLGEL